MSNHSHHSGCHSFTSIPQALTPLTPASTSSLSSSSSAVSRQSSCRSTASVQAVPFRTPIRGGSGAASSSMSRAGSGGVGRDFDSTGPGALTPIEAGGSYFPVPQFSGRKLSDRLSSQFLAPPVEAGVSTNGSSTTSSTGLASSSTMATNLTNWSAIGMGVNKTPSSQGDPAEERPPLQKGDGSTLSDQPATRPVNSRQGSAASVIVLRKTISDFQFGEILGEGSYSTVSLVTDKHPPHKSYALKVLDKEHIKREKKTKYVLIERDTLKTLDGHPGIVRLYWTFQDQRSLYYVLELAKNGELLKWIKKFGSFSLTSARFYAAQILSAVEHMHSKGVIHRDLKPENILLDDKMRIKVTDFGTAKLLEDSTSEAAPAKTRTRSFVGTPEYVSPEILSEGKESSKSSDYWGFGCILYQILAGRPPFQARTEYLVFQKIIKLEYDFPPEFPADAKDLVQKLLVLDPTERLGGSGDGIEAIKRHPFFTSEPAIDFNTIWKIDPPEIETGLVPPKQVTRGEFVMPEGLDTLDAFGEDDSDGDGENAAGLRRVSGESDGLESLSVSGEGEPATNGHSNGGANGGASGVDKPLPAEPVTKWTGVLLPRELILFASPVLDRGGFLNKQRTLILTDYPRLICIKETPTKVTLKSEVFLGVKPSSKAGAATFIKAEAETDRVFTVKTSQRTHKYEESTGSAARWVAELRDAHEKGRRE